tara:strand:+ start:123 stop:860 length:738 start_codon:yes stop_codon:yes gene_type:complete
MTAISLTDNNITQQPIHIAIIMDGNGRWAAARGLQRTAGHRRGAEAVRQSVEGAIKEGIKFLTLFGFSSENWKRSPEEIDDLMSLLRFYLKSEIKKLHKEGIRIRIIGDHSRLDRDISELIKEAEEKTSKNIRLNLTIALSYGSRAEIVAASQKIMRQILAGKLKIDEVSEELFTANLYTTELPDPDLLIRTSGEYRISNFLLWQIAYTELVFLDKHWPDFSKDDLRIAIEEFRSRERRFGTTGG